MRPIVIEKFPDFTSPLEGAGIYWMYLDDRGLVTTGRGNLVDSTPASAPWSLALLLPWKLPGGALAPKEEVIRQWQALKAQQNLKAYSAYSKTVQNATTLRLNEDDVLALVHQRLLQNEVLVAAAYPDYEEWPADAQMAAMSMGWAVGAAFPHLFVNCTRSLLAGHFHEVTIRPIGADGKEQPCECDISTKNNPGIVPRNACDRLLFNNAQAVVDQGLNPDTLYWPNAAPALADASPSSIYSNTLKEEADQAVAEWVAKFGWTGIGESDPTTDEA